MQGRTDSMVAPAADARACVWCSLLLRVSELHPCVSVRRPGGAVVCRNALAWAPIGTCVEHPSCPPATTLSCTLGVPVSARLGWSGVLVPGALP